LARRSPLLDLHTEGEGLPLVYGGGDGGRGGDGGEGGGGVALVAAFDPVPVEYAAVRSHAAVFDAAHRATIVVTGDDRVAFLNRMLTQELKGLGAYTAKRSFRLNRKGRIDADLRVIALPDRVLIDVDVHAAERTLAGLSAYVIAEDCRLEDATERFHRLALHGPAAAAVLARASTPVAGTPAGEIAAGQVSVVRVAYGGGPAGGAGGAEVVVDRQDMTGEIGLELLVPVEHAAGVYAAVSTPWSARGPGAAMTPGTALARRVGWHAVNMARVEAGWPLYLTDFGPDSLPHEAGDWTLHDRVSFRKGCYLGQEIVARMQALGHPKQKLVGVRFEGGWAAGAGGASAAMPEGIEEPQAVTGTALLAADAADAPVVGAVTSSCVSPMLGGAPIALAMVKHAHTPPGTRLWARVDAERIAGTVEGDLAFFRR
jgi:folate-binding protein YgfZ